MNRNTVRIRSVLVVSVLLTVSPGSLAAASATDAVLIHHGRGVRLVDPATGDARWQTERPDGLFASVSAHGIAYVSEGPADGSTTAVVAIDASGQAETIAEIPGRFAVARVSASGDELLLVEFPREQSGSLAPVGVRTLALPAPWRGPAPEQPAATRDNGAGVLAADGWTWYALRAIPAEGEPSRQEPALTVQRFEGGGPPAATTMPVSISAGYHSLLASPAMDRLYLVSYYDQTILVIDPAQLAVEQTVTFGTARFKHALCAAARSPAGDRLFVLANSASTRGDGVRVFDTASWREVGHFLPDQDLYCLTVAPDGDRLYVSTASTSELVAIDARSGDELGRAPLDRGIDWVASVIGAELP